MAAKPFESRIQDLVYNVEVGVGLRLIKAGLYILFVLVIMVVYTSNQSKGFRSAEAMEYSQLGKNLAKSNQLITQVIRPSSIWYLIEKSPDGNHHINNHPDILHPPVYPAMLATLFKAVQPEFRMPTNAQKFKPEQTVVIPLGQFLTVLSGIFLYLLGKSMFSPKVALLSTSIFFLSNAVWANAISGLPIASVLFFAIASFYFSHMAITKRQDGRPLVAYLIPLILASIFCVLAFLTRYPAIVLLPGLFLITGFGFKSRGWFWALVPLVIFILGSAPWVARNMEVSGGPFGLAPYEVFYDFGGMRENTFERTLAPNFDKENMSTYFQTKFMGNMRKFYNNSFKGLGDGLLACFFIVSFFYRFLSPTTHLLRWGILLSGILLLVVAGFYGESALRLLHIFWPIGIIYACAFFFLLLDRMQLNLKISNIAVTGALILTTALPLILVLLPPRASAPYPPYFPPFINYVCGMMNEEELICTDMPWATAWYSSQNSLLLPNTLDEFYDINDYIRPVRGLYFTTLTRDRAFVSDLARGSYKSWFPILQGRIPQDFPLNQGFPLNNLDQLFLSDRRRWEEQR